jgi:tetratricopeptide (TPR) repeat protein
VSAQPGGEQAGTVTASAADARENLYLHANTLRREGKLEDAERAYRAVLAGMPGHVDAATALAFMLRESGRLAAAAETLLWLWKARARRVEDSERTARFLRECDAWESALAVCEEQLRQTPGAARMLALAGDLELSLGRFDVAADHLRAALELDANQPRAWLRLAHTRRFERAGDPDIKRLRGAVDDAALGEDTRLAAAFALGKALDDIDHCEEAAGVLKPANAVLARRGAWSAARWHEAVAARCSAAPLARANFRPGFTPLFIVGLPRSGTTLLATLLARHRQVTSRGELHWAAAFAQHIENGGYGGNPRVLDGIADLFAAQLARDDAPARCYIDKNPLNLRYLDVIAALFPEARVVHCRRGRRDVALSLWSQYFAHADLGFTSDFGDIAAFAEGADRLMAHWREVAPLPILDVDYENLVAAPEPELARIMAFIGLDPDETAATAEAGTAAIATASVWQARQPVHTGSVGRWQRYRAWLPELESRFPDA